VSDQITRKELKQETVPFALENSVDYVSAHRSQLIKYGGGIVAVLLVVGLGVYYNNYKTNSRQQALGEAIALQAAPVGQAPPNGGPSFPTEAAKKDAIVKAYTKLMTEQSGAAEGYVAEYTLGAMEAEDGKLTEARKKFQDVASGGSAEYASMAKLALAQIAFAEDKNDEAKKLLKELADNPTATVSKNQANFVLARGIALKEPAEARKILSDLAQSKTEMSQIAVTALSELPPQ
jgi:predicted negative regulator of RcsB-dependent stress response